MNVTICDEIIVWHGKFFTYQNIKNARRFPCSRFPGLTRIFISPSACLGPTKTACVNFYRQPETTAQVFFSVSPWRLTPFRSRNFGMLAIFHQLKSLKFFSSLLTRSSRSHGGWQEQEAFQGEKGDKKEDVSGNFYGYERL